MRLAIVMPVLEEAAHVQTAIAAAKAHCDELIVVDGGSRDRTAELAAGAGARVETVPRAGRGLQLRTGAAWRSRPGPKYCSSSTPTRGCRRPHGPG